LFPSIFFILGIGKKYPLGALVNNKNVPKFKKGKSAIKVLSSLITVLFYFINSKNFEKSPSCPS